jgi:hypothetical protein
MSEIHESLTVLCPFDQIPLAAEAYVASLPVVDGKQIVALRITVVDLVIERRADLVLKHTRAYPGYEIMDLAWSAHGGGPYPIFRGTLSVEEGTTMSCRLDLDGKYDPPLNIAGAVFDAIAGHRIAVEAARALLDEIRIGFEFAFQTGKTMA